MNYIKAQQDSLKQHLKGERTVYVKFKDDNYNEVIAYGDPKHIYVTPADKVGIYWECSIKEDTIKAVLNDEKDVDVYLTGQIIQTDKKLLRCFTDNKDLQIYIDDKLLKNFKLEQCTFKGISPVQPIHIYEDGVQVGLVFPIRVPKNS